MKNAFNWSSCTYNFEEWLNEKVKLCCISCEHCRLTPMPPLRKLSIAIEIQFCMYRRFTETLRLDWPNSQIPQCTCSISHNAIFRTEICTFLFWILNCLMWNRFIMGFVRLAFHDSCGLISLWVYQLIDSQRIIGETAISISQKIFAPGGCSSIFKYIIGLGNGLLPEPVLSYHQWGPSTKCQRTSSLSCKKT